MDNKKVGYFLGTQYSSMVIQWCQTQKKDRSTD